MAVNYKDNRRDILIGLDVGYDATKVCINGVITKIPNNVLDVTGHSKEFLSLGDQRTGGYICSYYVKDKEYIIGELARKSVNEKNAKAGELIKQQVNDSNQRFSTLDFEANVMTVIGVALIEYAKATMKNQWKPSYFIKEDNEPGRYIIPDLAKARIIVGVALPNDYVNAVWPDISRFLIKSHKFEITTQDGTFTLDFKIDPGHAMAESQVKCALLGTVSDDSGEMIEAMSLLNELPLLVVDGGYKTIGNFLLTKALQVSQAESNEDYAMGNVHKEVAKILQEKFGREDIEAFMIPSILENDNGKVIGKDKDNNNAVIEVDLRKIVKDIQKKMCEGLIEYLNSKFNELLDIKAILVTGGTGAAYYEPICSYVQKNRGYLENKVYLTDYKFYGKQIDPVYAIAVGMYKILRHQVNKSNAKEDADRGAGQNVSQKS